MGFVTLVASGITLDLVSFRRRPDRRRGEVAVAFDNTLQDGTDRPMREWEGETIGMEPADVDALRAAIGSGPVYIIGTKLRNENVRVLITVEGEGTERDGAGDDEFLEPLTLLFRET